MTHWRRKPDAVELTAIYIRMLAEIVAITIIIAEAAVICILLTGGK